MTTPRGAAAPPTLEEQVAEIVWLALTDGRVPNARIAARYADRIHALYADALASLAAERDALVEALHDAIRRPMGVVPDSAAEFYDPTRALAAAAPPQEENDG